MPADMQWSKNSTVTVSDARYIDGKQSLRWTWKGGPAWLVIHHPIAYVPGRQRLFGEAAGNTFAPWIYLHQPMQGKLHFTFGKQGQSKPNCGFEFGLDFSGWRTAWLMYNRDMQGKPVVGMNEIRIQTPRSADHGEIYLDSIVLSELVDARHPYPDRQVPYVNKKAITQHWLPQLSLLKLAANPMTSTASQEQLAAVDVIVRRVEQLYLPTNQNVSHADVDALIDQYKKYDISEGPDGLRGRHVCFTLRQIVVYPQDLRAKLSKEFISLKTYQEQMLKIAQAYHAPNLSAQDRGRLSDAFIMMARQFLDQGWGEGSTLGTVHHLGYSFRDIAPAALLMRDVLAKADLREPIGRSIAWYFNTNIVFRPGEIHSDMDYYNTLAMGHLVSILLLPDGPAKVVTLQKFSDMLSRIMADKTPGIQLGFKVDGTAFHHFGHYPAYAAGAFANGSKVVRALAGTPFALTPAAQENFRHAMMTMRIYSNPDWAIGFSGRHPMPVSISENTGILSLKDAFVNMAFSGNPKTGAPVDDGVLGAAERIWPALLKNPKIAALHVAPEPMPHGHWTLNYAAAGIHRYDDKTVTLKGYNNNVWSSEIYTHANRFGRYQSNGSISILNQGGNTDSGFVQAGWDWDHNPGTTAVNLPLDILDAPGNGTVMLKSPKTFSGDCNLNGKYGAFAIDLYDQKLPGSKGLAAHKSAFCFGPRIVCLGTGISSPNAQYPTQTTIYQTHLRSATDPIWVDATKPITQLPLTLDPPTNKPSVLVDPYGNGYYIPAGQHLVVSRQLQHSRTDETESPTQGDFASAWIDHGKAPSNKTYSYAIVLGADIKQMLAFEQSFKTKTPPYSILRQDNIVHAVWDRATGVTGIACFEPVTNLQMEKCPVRAVDRPVLVMTQSESNSTLDMSVCDPSLHLVDGKSKPVQVNVVLAGSWSVSAEKDVKAAVTGDQTTLHVCAYQAQSVQIILKKGAVTATSK